METINIRYLFKLDKATEEKIEVRLDKKSLESLDVPTENLPEWTRLDFHQCSHCPLDSAKITRCPLTLQLVNVIPLFERMSSYDEIDVIVQSGEREFSLHTSVQRALSSLMGLVIATSGCPHTKFFRSMARFHMPFGDEEETLFRAVSSYLLAQYFLQKSGQKPDLELTELGEIYENMHRVNSAIAERIKAFSQTDASTNALILLDLFTKAMPYVIEESLDELEYIFQPYLQEINPIR